MADFLLLVVAALVVAGIVFGVVSFALGRESGLSEPEPDGVAEPLPDRPLSADDLDQARFDVVLRGYRMDEVDTLVNRAASDLRQLQEYADSLEGQLAAARGGPVAERRTEELAADEPVADGPAADEDEPADEESAPQDAERRADRDDRADVPVDHG